MPTSPLLVLLPVRGGLSSEDARHRTGTSSDGSRPVSEGTLEHPPVWQCIYPLWYPKLFPAPPPPAPCAHVKSNANFRLPPNEAAHLAFYFK